MCFLRKQKFLEKKDQILWPDKNIYKTSKVIQIIYEENNGQEIIPTRSNFGIYFIHILEWLWLYNLLGHFVGVFFGLDCWGYQTLGFSP